MLRDNLEQQFITINKQRRLFFVLFLLTFGMCFILSVATYRHDKQTILVPLGLTQPVTVSTTQLSKSYIAHMTDFFIYNMLELHVGNIAHKQQAILPHVTAEAHQEVTKRFEAAIKEYREHSLSTMFTPDSIIIDNENLTAEVRGTLYSFFAKAGREETKLTIDIAYNYKSGIFALSKFNIRNQHEKNNK